MFIKHEAVEPFGFDGLKITDYTAGQDISSSLAEIIVPAGVSHKFSWSKRSDKYYYIVYGSITFSVDGDIQNLTSGDVCIVPKGARFNYTNDGPVDAKLILIHTPGFKLDYEVFEE